MYLDSRNSTYDETRSSQPPSITSNEKSGEMKPRSVSVKTQSGLILVAELRTTSLKKRKFHSARLIGKYEKPWLAKQDPRMFWDKAFFWGFALIGICLGGYIVYTGWNKVENPPYCLVFEDDFSNGISPDDWNYEVQLGGYGTGSFDWTTRDSHNAYADENGLHIVPTLTTQSTSITGAQLLNGYTVNLTETGTCTATNLTNCAMTSNSSIPTMINPVQSARLNTKGKHNITYGKIEVRARVPKGDWLWPAIWMLPEASVYGEWPASGEIDIMEQKSNPIPYKGGRNTVSGTLHWGPTSVLDAFWRSSGTTYMQRGDYSDEFHTFGMEWSDKYIYTYIDSRLRQSMYTAFGQKYGSMYDRGKFAKMTVNSSIPADPWSTADGYNAPFNEAFYLILNVAVGSTNGYFVDGYGGKPWVDGSSSAMEQFWNARDVWEPTWGEGDLRGMTVQSVKMWRRGECASTS